MVRLRGCGGIIPMRARLRVVVIDDDHSKGRTKGASTTPDKN